MQRFQQQFEGAFERNLLVKRDGDGSVAAHRFGLQPDHIEIEGNIGLLGEGVEYGRQRLVVVGGLHLRGELPVNGCLSRRDPRLPLRVQTRAILGEVFPVLGLGKLDRPDERLAGALHVFNNIEETALLFPFDRFLRVEPTDHPALGQQLPNHCVVGGELASLLGDGLCFGIPPFIDERVVILDQHCQTLVDLHPLGTLAVDLRLHLGVALVEGHFGPPLAGGFFDIPSGAVDSLGELDFGLRRNVAGVHLGLGGVEQGHGIQRGPLGGAFGFQLLGGDFSRQLGHHEVLRQQVFFVRGSPLGSWLSGGRHRRRRLPRPGHGCFDRPSGVGSLGGAAVIRWGRQLLRGRFSRAGLRPTDGTGQQQRCQPEAGAVCPTEVPVRLGGPIEIPNSRRGGVEFAGECHETKSLSPGKGHGRIGTDLPSCGSRAAKHPEIAGVRRRPKGRE